MADNIPITGGAGINVAADEIAGVFYQRVKLGVGADGEAADLDSGQATMANSIPVVIASDQSAVKSSDAGPSWTSVFGVSGARYTSADRSGSAASVTDAPTGGQKIVITDIFVSVDTAMRVDFKEQTSGTVVLSIYLPANGTAQLTPRSKLKLATADRTLQVQTSAAGNIAVTCCYFSEA